MNTTNSSYFPLFFRRFICFILAFCMVFQIGRRNESYAFALPAWWVGASVVEKIALVWTGIEATNLAFSVASSVVGYFQDQFDKGHSEEFEDFCYSLGLDPNNYDSEDEFFADPNTLTLIEAMGYNAGMYGTTADHIASILKAWNLDYPDEIHSNFNNWRIISPGYEDEFYNHSFLESEQTAAADSSLIKVVEPNLSRSNSNGLIFELPELLTNSLHFYKNTYISSDVFTVNQNVSAYFSSYNSGNTVLSDYTDFDTETTLKSQVHYGLFRYDGDDYLSDSKFMEPLTNIKWTKVNDFTGSFYHTLETDKMYILIQRIYISPDSYLNMKDREFSYLITTPNKPYITFKGSSNLDSYFTKSPEAIDSPVYTSIITNYTNYYVDGNWYEGDHNEDNSGGGSGSGDGSLSGDVNVTVDGELDHHLDGDINVNVNIDTEPGDPEETNGIIAWILNNILSFIGNCITYILDTIFSLFESVIEEFLGWLPDLVNTEVFQAINSIFSWLPEKASNFITFGILIALFVGVFGYFKR